MNGWAHRLLTVLVGAMVCLGAAGSGVAAAREVRRGLELDLALERDGKRMPLETQEADGVQAVVVEAPAAGEAKVSAEGEFNWTDAQALVFRARLAGDDAGPVQLIFFFQDVDFWWFQKLVRAEPAAGRWREIAVPLVPQAVDAGTKHAWHSIGHSKPYDRNALRKARRVGLIVIPGTKRKDGAGPARVLLAKPELVLKAGATPKPPRPYNLVSPSCVRRYERFEVAFRLDKTYANPFDPGEVDVRAHVTTPSGRVVEVFGFWYQNYRRRVMGRTEELVPVGEPSWRVRFAPSELGVHGYTITVRDAAGELTTKARRFEVLDGPSDGFLRVSKTDYHYLEFDNGRPWWGIGVNLHCTYDYRYNAMVRNRERLLEMDRRSLFYDDRLAKCAAHGMNWTEFWIASWGFEIEWRGDWRGWAGAGHYSLENAWRLDRALAQCRDYGVYVNVVLTCHGSYYKGSNQGPTQHDAEFQHHAYFRGNGGWLDDGGQMFTDARAHEAMRKRLRYIIARTSDSTNVASWEMISESELVPGGKNASRPFVFAMAEMVKQMDPYAHPVSNHYCGSYGNVDPLCARDPRMDVVAGNAYRGGPGQRGRDGTEWGVYFEPYPDHLARAAEHFDTYRKPIFVTEAGGRWSAGPAPLLEADIHALNWAAWVTTLPATPLTWWEDFVDEYELWGDYAAFARYAAGEDKRARGLSMDRPPVLDAAHKEVPRLFSRVLGNRTGGYAWVYDEDYYEFGSTQMVWQRRGVNYHAMFGLKRERPTRRFKGAQAIINGLDEGTFDVEVWDTYTGEVVATAEIDSADGTIIVPLPEFSRDIALKFSKRVY